MTSEIPKNDWGMFLDDLTKRRFGWETKVEVIGKEIGDQILDEGLPLGGITCERRGEDTFIEIFIGDDDRHQSHNIKNPTKIVYLGRTDGPGGVVEFEEADETKTLLYIIEPQPLVVRYVRTEELTAA